MSLYALVPAAGRGERFGGPKLLSRWKDREILGHVLAVLTGARAAGLLASTFVVHRPDDDPIARLVSEYLAYPVTTREAEPELCESIRAGLAEIRLRDTVLDRSAILICLGDQPLVRLDVIQALIHAWRTGSAAARPSYRDDPGSPGHPLLLDRSLWGVAADLRGDTGFGPALERRGIAVATVSVAGHNPDIDRVSDLLALDRPTPLA